MNLFELGGAAAALAAAQRGGLLAMLGERGGTAETLAAELGLNPRAAGRVLEVLRTFGFADCEDGVYSPSAALAALNRIGPGGIAGLGRLWAHTPDFLLRGEQFQRMDGPAEVREASYKNVVKDLSTMFAISARHLARIVAPAANILDIGSGAGIWSLAMAEQHPESRVTAVDFPDVLDAFRAQAEALGLSARIGTIAGDAFTVDLPERFYDRVVIANVLHLESPERAVVLIHRAAAALAPGGELVIVDILSDGTQEAERTRAIYGLHLAMRTERGSAHEAGVMEGWLVDVGFAPPRLEMLDGAMHGIAALVARKLDTAGAERAEGERYQPATA
jgi:2-polyprenyl-3-methyl-5-hydroxy-6-metoxy-1,4-benzoquinol methylase